MSSGFCSLHRRCGACGVVFERDPGEVMGGVFVNSMVTTLAICALAGWLEFYSPVPRGWATPIVIGFAALFPILFYRHSRAFWIGLLHLTGLVHRDEAADPEPRISPWPSSSGPGGGGPPTLPSPESTSAPAVTAAGFPWKRIP